jgi:predicted AlkP superfamily phosphohydrolase/phosphomutase/tetratricopeptide (TPR) repeat protein
VKSPEIKPKILLVGWDAADPKVLTPLMERGEMPVFSRLVDQGTVADMVSLQPMLSPLLWNSIATGKRADRHGILGFTEVDPDSGRVRPAGSTSRRTKALWNILSQSGYRTNVAGWFASHPAEPIRGVCVSDAFVRALPAKGQAWRLLPGTVYPDSLAPVFEDLRLRPEEIDEEIFRLFIPRLDEIDKTKPNGLNMLAKILAECFTTHAAATWMAENTEWDFMAAYYIGLDHFSHGFMNYHPPRPTWVDEREFDLYRDVVSGGYRLMDLFLGRLIQLAGPGTTVLVISDHGFHSDHLRPRHIPDTPAGPAAQHRPLGIFAMAGKGIRPDERVYGVGLLDIAPTVLALFGLPAAEDMPGRVLAEAFDPVPDLGRIPSWDVVDGESGMHSPGDHMHHGIEKAEHELIEQALVEQFVALGYIDPQPLEQRQAAIDCERERQWNLARVYTSTQRFAEALPLLEQLHGESPGRTDFALALADALLRLGLLEEAEATAAAAIQERPDSPVAHMVLAGIAFERRDYRGSLGHLLETEKSASRSPEVWLRIGFVYSRLRRWEDARRAYARALETDPHSPLAHQGLARVLLRQGKVEQAVESALDSAACRHDAPLTHFLLGVALWRTGRRERAIQALETSLSFSPPLGIAHRVLATIHGNSAEGQRHREAARRFLTVLRQDRIRLEAVRKEARQRATERVAARAESGQLVAAASLTFTIVSGLPHSGTSLMMRMLQAAGLPLMTDGERTASKDSSAGNFEWEAIRRIGAQPELMRQAEGKVVEVISMLLPVLPPEHRYKVLFMDRPVEEVAASQLETMRRRGGSGQTMSIGEMERTLREHRERILDGLHSAPRFEVLEIGYSALVHSPEDWLPEIESFIGRVPDPEAMLRVIRSELSSGPMG